MKTVTLGKYNISNNERFTLIAGPCQMESRDHAMFMAEKLKEVCEEVGVNLIYKSSFDKANRTSLSGKRGLGLAKSLPVFAEVKEQFGLPTLTDIHNEAQCAEVGDAIDVLQIPAFLCRQTDLLIAAAKTGKVINIKKGQFLAPWDMTNVAKKVSESGNDSIILTDRGTSFGYNTLVSDMRSFKIMAEETGYPICVDATHSIQQPGGMGGSSGGQRDLAQVIARAAIAVGIGAVFTEVHQDPDNAPSDGPCMIELHNLKEILKKLVDIDDIIKR